MVVCGVRVLVTRIGVVLVGNPLIGWRLRFGVDSGRIYVPRTLPAPKSAVPSS